MEKKYNLTNDLLFKKILTSEQNEHILKNFINDITGENFKEVKASDTYSIKKYKEALNKNQNELFTTIVDISATTEDGTSIIIEMQILNQSHYIERSIFYLANKYTELYTKERKYKNLKPVYSINILDYHLFDKNQKALKKYTLKDQETNEELTNKNNNKLLTLCYFSLINENIESEKIKAWRDLFKNGEITEQAPSYIKEAKQQVEEINLEEEELMLITQQEKIRADYEGTIDYATNEGLKRGREEGREEGRTETMIKAVISMLIEGFNIDIVSRVSGFPQEKVLAIKNEHNL